MIILLKLIVVHESAEMEVAQRWYPIISLQLGVFRST
jgi:hypothetical protein